MPNVKKITLDWSETGKTIYCIIRREADGYRLNDADGAFASNPADPYLSLSEDTVIKGRYEVSESRQAWNDGNYSIAIYKQAGGSPAPASDTIIGTGSLYIISDMEIILNADVGAVKTVTDKFLFDGSNFVKSVQQGAVDILQSAADKVWSSSVRTLTSFAALISDIWAYAARKLTSAWTDEATPRDMAAVYLPTGTNTVTIKTLTAGLLAIPDAELIIENNLSQVIATGVTDANGEFKLNLDDGAYTAKPRKSMVNFPVSQSLVVDPLNLIFTITGSPLLPTIPSVGLQTIYGTVLNINKSYAASKKVDAYIQEPQIIAAAFLTKMILNDTTDANGYFELQIIKGAEITVTIENHGSKHIIVTDDDMKDLAAY